MRGLSYSDSAVLVRVTRMISEIANALDAHDIPCVVGGVASRFDAPEAAARELFYYLAGRSDGRELRAAWSAAALGTSVDDLNRALRTAREDRRSIDEWVRAVRDPQPAAFVPLVPR